jgi:hypothetical protein
VERRGKTTAWRSGHPRGSDARAPNANVYAERFVRSIKEECLDRLIPFGERHFWYVIAEFVDRYHRERNHQGLANRLIAGTPVAERPGRVGAASGWAGCSISMSGPRDRRVGRELEHFYEAARQVTSSSSLIR